MALLLSLTSTPSPTALHVALGGSHRRRPARALDAPGRGRRASVRCCASVYVDASLPDSTAAAAPGRWPSSRRRDAWSATGRRAGSGPGLTSPGSSPRRATVRRSSGSATRTGRVTARSAAASGGSCPRTSSSSPTDSVVTTPTPHRVGHGPLRAALRRPRCDGRADAGLTASRSLELVDRCSTRFNRQRGVVQLRELAPLVDPRSESIGESAVRLHWFEIPYAPGSAAAGARARRRQGATP